MNKGTLFSSSYPVLAITTRGVAALVVVVIAANALWTAWVWHKHGSHKGQIESLKRGLETDQELLALQQERSELLKRSQAASAAAAVAVSVHTMTLAQVRHLTNVLERLGTSAAATREELAALLTNDVGRSMTQKRELVIALHHLYQTDGPSIASSEEIQQRLVEAKRFEILLAEELGATYDPQPAVTSRVTDGIAWATAEVCTIDRVRLLLKTLAREGEIARRLTPGTNTSLTLAEAMEDYAASKALAELRRAISTAGTEVTRATGAAVVDAAGNATVTNTQQVAAVPSSQAPQTVQVKPQAVRLVPEVRGSAEESADPWQPSNGRRYVSIGGGRSIIHR